MTDSASPVISFNKNMQDYMQSELGLMSSLIFYIADMAGDNVNQTNDGSFWTYRAELFNYMYLN